MFHLSLTRLGTRYRLLYVKKHFQQFTALHELFPEIMIFVQKVTADSKADLFKMDMVREQLYL